MSQHYNGLKYLSSMYVDKELDVLLSMCVLLYEDDTIVLAESEKERHILCVCTAMKTN